jgi:hypothetical protein
MGGVHSPGWRSPANRKLRNYLVQLRPDTLAAWKEAAARAGLSQRQATEYVYRAFAREMGIDLAPAQHAPERGEPKPLTRLIVPPLDC